jgi:hypothetical protein
MVVGLSIGGLVRWWNVGVCRERRLDRRLVDEKGVVGETGVPLAALGVEDPEGRLPTRRAVAVVRDERLGTLADDVAAQADPRPSSELEPDAGRLGDRGREAAGESGRIEDQQQGLRAPGERGKSVESIGDPGRLVRLRQSTAGQVEHEHVDRPSREETAGDRQPLIEAGRGDDDEPFEADAAGDGLDRIEAPRQVEPGHDRALRLRLRRDPQGERRPAAGAVAADRDAGRLRETARTQDRVERGEAGVDDAVVVETRLVAWLLVRRPIGKRRDRQCPDDPRSCRTPSSPQARDSGIHITTRGRHRTSRLEHMFYNDKPW